MWEPCVAFSCLSSSLSSGASRSTHAPIPRPILSAVFTLSVHAWAFMMTLLLIRTRRLMGVILVESLHGIKSVDDPASLALDTDCMRRWHTVCS